MAAVLEEDPADVSNQSNVLLNHTGLTPCNTHPDAMALAWLDDIGSRAKVLEGAAQC